MNEKKVQRSVIPVILCGGSGTRLWPLSRKSFPKQFIKAFDNKSLFQKTFERAKSVSSDGRVCIIGNKNYRFLIDDDLSSYTYSGMKIFEPVGRNTAAAMCAAALNHNPEDFLLFMPADHLIADSSSFVKLINMSINKIKSSDFFTYGIKPTSVHTGYGYIKVMKQKECEVFEVEKFTEKPKLHKAKEFFSSNQYFWNAGIFLVKAATLIKVLSELAPDVFEHVKKSVSMQKIVDKNIFLDDVFERSPNISIDYAILENSNNIKMVPFSGKWSDVGNWNAFSEAFEMDLNGNGYDGNAFISNSESCFVYASTRPVIAVGIKDIIVVDTKDAVLVSSKNHSEEIKDIVEELREKKLSQADFHNFSNRPWGKFEVIDEGENFKVKRISVNPGSILSLQLHHHRTEHWIVVKGCAKVTCGDQTFTLNKNESTFIPVNTKHRLENIGDEILEMIEVQSGNYLEEDDIIRLEDAYGRSNDN